ncbi:MAG: M55 family metallopeptidase [Theionarchaea archaeon]|nr:M55 family metallopeptidase [Theionarchaea archaeon]
MKVYISADIEGICGVVALDHTSREGKDYDSARLLMTREVNEAVRGAFEGGASQVLVNDSHGSMINLILEELDERVTLICGSPKPLSMLEGIGECDAAFFIGYHSPAGTTDAVLDHTYHGRVVYDLQVNGKKMGEFAMNAALAGYFGIPVILVSGDKKTTEEASSLLDPLETVVSKEGIGRFAARSSHPAKVRGEIRTKAKHAVEIVQRFSPYQIDPPLHLHMDFLFSHMADRVELLPTVKRVSARSVTYSCDDFSELYKMLRAMILIASTGIPPKR